MDAPLPDADLDKLTISDLESMLADKRRRQGQRMLRTIAGRGQVAGAASGPRQAPHGLAGPPTPAVAAPPAQAAPGPPPRMTARPASLVSPPFPDRFGRPILVLPTHDPTVQDGTWVRRSGSQRIIDRSLQLAEAAIVLILLFVVGEWAYTSFFEADPSLADVTAAGPTTSFVLTPHPRSSVTPLIAAAHAPSVAPARTATSTPGPRLATLSNEESDVVAQGGVLPTTTPVPTATPQPPTPSPTIDPALRLPDRLIIPSIKLDAKVREVQLQLAADEAIWEVADYMAGHHTGTANPGEIGNMVIAGHRDIRGKVFWFLDKLKPGDEIFVHNGLGTYRYVVRLSKIVKPTQVEVMAPTTDARLTLITCTPIGIASHRLIVVADYDPTYDDSNP